MLPSPAIVIEWETGLDCDLVRLRRAVGSVKEQLQALSAELDGAAETLVCFDPAAVDGRDLEEVFGPTGAWPGHLQMLPTPGLDYYQKKNAGFAASRNSVVIFLDSDLLPEPGWLRAMLEPFADPRKVVVVGRTHLDHDTLYERAIALSWIFDTRLPTDELRPTGRLVSNNIAFRRPVFRRWPFPDRPSFRGQCSELGTQLRQAGILMYENTAARASHPSHRGLRAFVERAWAAGRDQCFYDRLHGKAALSQGRAQWAEDRRQVASRISQRAGLMQARRRDRVAAWLLGGAYYLCKFVAYTQAVVVSRSPQPDNVNQGG